MKLPKKGFLFERLRTITGIGAGIAVLLSPVVPAAAAAASHARADAFASAAQEFAVPEPLLLAISYNESRWLPHGSSPSSDNGYGIMDLRTKKIAHPTDGRGLALGSPQASQEAQGTRFTMDDASRLLGVSADTLKQDEKQNIRGAAAVLAGYAKEGNGGTLPSAVSGWYGAVAAYSGAVSPDTAKSFADSVYDTLQKGASSITADGQALHITAVPDIKPDLASLDKLVRISGAGAQPLSALTQRSPGAGGGGSQRADCPATLDCRFVPAAYTSVDPNDPTNYGNYDPANRPHDMKINYIVIHDTEGSYESSINWFQTTGSYVSANYIIRSSDGAVTEMVHPGDVAWHAGDWYVNMHSIGIEHEGFAAQGATWYTEAMYRSSANLVRYLAAKYGVPLDRQHILGHDNIPTLSGARMAGQHNDPGPYWDWNHYMELLGAPIEMGKPVTDATTVVTIAPHFSTNQQEVQDCATTPCTTLPAQGSNMVYLHTAPSNASPLLSDPYLHPDNAPGTTSISDWSAVANAGDQFVLAGKQGDWTGVWYGGKVGWFYNPGGSTKTAYRSRSRVITPRAGLASIPVYGGAYPEAAAYPTGVPVQNLSPLYTLPAGQAYVTSDRVSTDYFYDATINYSLPHDHEIIRGNDVYYQISFNHRQAYVKAGDVQLRNR